MSGLDPLFQQPPDPWYATPEALNTLKWIAGVIVTALIGGYTAFTRYVQTAAPVVATPTTAADIAGQAQGASLRDTQAALLAMARLMDDQREQMDAKTLENEQLALQRTAALARADTAEIALQAATARIVMLEARINELEQEVASLRQQVNGKG